MLDSVNFLFSQIMGKKLLIPTGIRSEQDHNILIADRTQSAAFPVRHFETGLQLLNTFCYRKRLPMKSCFGGFTDEEIAWIRAFAREREKERAAQKAKGEAETGGGPNAAAFSSKICTFAFLCPPPGSADT